MTTYYYDIQIKQRGGKWVYWSGSDHKERIDAEWASVPSLRRRARCVKTVDGIRKVLARYEPPKVTK